MLIAVCAYFTTSSRGVNMRFWMVCISVLFRDLVGVVGAVENRFDGNMQQTMARKNVLIASGTRKPFAIYPPSSSMLEC